MRQKSAGEMLGSGEGWRSERLVRRTVGRESENMLLVVKTPRWVLQDVLQRMSWALTQAHLCPQDELIGGQGKPLGCSLRRDIKKWMGSAHAQWLGSRGRGGCR